MNKKFPKKEKGTQGVPNSDKNQDKYTKKISETILNISDHFHTNLLRRYNYLSEPSLIRENDSLIREFSNLKRVIENDPRLPWQIIQQNIDNLYKKDKNLIGVNVKIIFNDLKENNIKHFNPLMYGIPS